MTWAMYHSQSGYYASLAELATKEGDLEHAAEFYRLAAEQESLALDALDPNKKRTAGITTVSAASLWFKAREFQQAQSVAYQGLASGSLPDFAIEQLQNLLQIIWTEEARIKAGVKFTEGEVLVSVSGGEIMKGGAPLELIHRKVDEVGRLFYRTIELMLNFPHRKRGAPSLEIQEQFRPWLFQAPAGSYQFAVRVERPKQMALFPEFALGVDQITQKFLDIVRASVDDPQELATIVPNEEYRDTFMKLTRNLAPTGKVFGRLEIKSPSEPSVHPIVLMPAARETISQALRKPQQDQEKKDELKEVELKGILRGLQLDNDWLEINEADEGKGPTRIFEAGDVIDDVVGPLVNRRVIVSVVQRPSGKYAFRDIQAED